SKVPTLTLAAPTTTCWLVSTHPRSSTITPVAACSLVWFQRLVVSTLTVTMAPRVFCTASTMGVRRVGFARGGEKHQSAAVSAAAHGQGFFMVYSFGNLATCKLQAHGFASPPCGGFALVTENRSRSLLG